MIRPKRARPQQPVNLRALANPYLRSVWSVIPALVLTVFLATPHAALAAPFIEWTYSNVGSGLTTYVLGGDSFELYENTDELYATATTISGFSSLAEVAPSDIVATITDFELISVTRTADSLDQVWGDTDGSPPVFRFFNQSVEFASSPAVVVTGHTEIIPSGTPGFPSLGVGVSTVRFTLVGTPGDPFYDEIFALTGGSLELFARTTGGGVCDPYPADPHNCTGTTALLIPVMPSDSVGPGAFQETLLLGGEGAVGGVAITLDTPDGGDLSADYAPLNQQELNDRVLNGDFSAFDFSIPGDEVQVWDVKFTGAQSGDATVIFSYDDTVLGSAFPENNLAIYHFTGGAWTRLPGIRDVVQNTITVQVSSFSPFVLGVIPEPSTALLLATGLGILAFRRKRVSQI